MEGNVGLKRVLPSRGIGAAAAEADSGAQVIPEPGSLIGDLLSMDLGAPAAMPGAAPMGNVDLLGGGLDDLVGLGGGGAAPAAAKPVSVMYFHNIFYSFASSFLFTNLHQSAQKSPTLSVFA